MQPKKSMIIGTAGHIDHGKTALVKALTGVDTDRLPEEKERGITIDLGFAHWDLGDMEVSFIDVPGHERFVRNMLAGIGGIDLLMLVVAADESVMPQTREHFDICRLLGISSGMIVLTKKDLVDDETLKLAKADVDSLVAGTFLEGAPVHAVSARTGEGLDALKAGLQDHLQHMEQRRSSGIFRLPVDRVFTLKGHGTVVTGTLIAGRLRKDQSVEILPSGKKSRIRSIHAHDRNVDEALAGQRTAVNLISLEKDDLARGDVLTQPDFLRSTSLLDVKITLLQGVRPLVHNALVRFHHQASDPLARVTLLGRESLPAGEFSFAQLRLQKPVLALYGDRFILRRHSPPVTIGGGVILDHLPQKRIRRGDAEALVRLPLLENAAPEQRLLVAVAQRGLLGADEEYLQARLALDAGALRSLKNPEIVVLRSQPLILLAAAAVSRILQRLREVAASFHEKNPLLPGIPKGEMRTRHLASLSHETFSACLDHAVAKGIIKLEKDFVSLAERRMSLTAEDETLAAAVEDALRQTGLEFPGFEDLSRKTGRKPEDVKKILYLLARQHRVVKIADDYFLLRHTWDDLKTGIVALRATQKTFSVLDFKEKFGVSRKYAIPLLEQLDREGVTRRRGNERIIL